MGFQMAKDEFNLLLKKLGKSNRIFAPKLYKGAGKFSDTDLVAYGEINYIDDIIFDTKTSFSAKEIVFPINQTMFYFTEEEYREPAIDERGIIIFLRACDIHAFKRLDAIFLENGPYKDNYYEKLRKKVKFFLMECAESFSGCFCVSMNTNSTEDYSVFVRKENDIVFCQVKDNDFLSVFNHYGMTCKDPVPDFVSDNTIQVKIPSDISEKLYKSSVWDEYNQRCIACGRCNISCPTCSCFTVQDIFYRDNPASGERQRVWAGCLIDGFTEMAGGHGFRQSKGDRMRFKAMHKIYDFRQRFGFDMCVGCGRCDDVCPEYISFPGIINKVYETSTEGGE
jgi:anaerobic sulfite reductase subunit A